VQAQYADATKLQEVDGAPEHLAQFSLHAA
jgi:hypothetical protein